MSLKTRRLAPAIGMEVIGLEDSFDGLLDRRRCRELTPRDVRGILRLGGTVLGTTNRGNPFAYPVTTGSGTADYSTVCVENFSKMGLDALVVIGGDGTLAIAHTNCRGPRTASQLRYNIWLSLQPLDRPCHPRNSQHWRAGLLLVLICRAGHSHVRHFKLQAWKFLACPSSCSTWPPLGMAGGTIMKRRLIML